MHVGCMAPSIYSSLVPRRSGSAWLICVDGANKQCAYVNSKGTTQAGTVSMDRDGVVSMRVDTVEAVASAV